MFCRRWPSIRSPLNCPQQSPVRRRRQLARWNEKAVDRKVLASHVSFLALCTQTPCTSRTIFFSFFRLFRRWSTNIRLQMQPGRLFHTLCVAGEFGTAREMPYDWYENRHRMSDMHVGWEQRHRLQLEYVAHASVASAQHRHGAIQMCRMSISNADIVAIEQHAHENPFNQQRLSMPRLW